MNCVQIRELSEILELLDEILETDERGYFVTIDRLDENWIEDRFRYLLVRALIETVRDFRKVRRAKIIIALRRDLLERVFRHTRDPGFQEEKYEDSYLDVNWNKDQLIDLLNRRVSFLVRGQYTQAGARAEQLLPTKVKRLRGIDYIISRTLMRPRDVILFFNKCIEQAADRPSITAEMIKRAEGEYSRLRLRAIADEWQADYPNLMVVTELLKGRPEHFRLDEINDTECEDLCLRILTNEGPPAEEGLSRAARQVIDELSGVAELRRNVAQVLYQTGVVGMKLHNFEAPLWASGGRRSISWAEIQPDTRLYVHPAFWRTLGIKDQRETQAQALCTNES